MNAWRDGDQCRLVAAIMAWFPWANGRAPPAVAGGSCRCEGVCWQLWSCFNYWRAWRQQGGFEWSSWSWAASLSVLWACTQRIMFFTLCDMRDWAVRQWGAENPPEVRWWLWGDAAAGCGSSQAAEPWCRKVKHDCRNVEIKPVNLLIYL